MKTALPRSVTHERRVMQCVGAADLNSESICEAFFVVLSILVHPHKTNQHVLLGCYCAKRSKGRSRPEAE